MMYRVAPMSNIAQMMMNVLTWTLKVSPEVMISAALQVAANAS